MKLSKKKVSLKTDKSETKSSEEENVKIEADTNIIERYLGIA